ncbi:hypothetical protein LJR034_003080 [Caballeronia sp. LjRoot34]|uniref:hypothetical protein n=1 Tax=Caballeronia sp. LjRoot34 TaxID=3342325 RepID=UPI003ED02CDA
MKRSKTTLKVQKFSALQLGRIFPVGIRIGLWTTRAAAAKKLDATAPELSRGVQVAALPNEILDLFSADDITDYVARKLLETIKSDGLPTVLTRANNHAVHSDDRSAAAVMAALRARPLKRQVRAKKTSSYAALTTFPETTRRDVDGVRKRLPLDIARQFKDGKARGEWSTITEGARRLGFPRTTVSRALSIDALPEYVKKLLPREKLTLAVGAELVEIKNDIGISKLQRNAYLTEGWSAIRPVRVILDELAIGGTASPEKIKIRVRQGYQNQYLKIECSHMIVVSRYRKEIEAMIRRLIRMRRDKRDESELFSEDELAKFYDVLPKVRRKS